MICEKLASNTMLYEVLRVFSGCEPKGTRTEGLTYKGLSCGMMATKTGVYLSHELSSFFFRDKPLEYYSGTFFVRFPLMDFIGLGALNDAIGLCLIIGAHS